MRFLKKLFLYFFIFIKSEIEDLEKKNDLIEINVISNIKIKDEQEIFRATVQVLNNPLDKNYIISIKPRTVPVSGFTSKTLYLGYPVSGAISTNPFPTTTEFGLVCLVGNDYNLSGHYFLTNSSLGWKLGAPNQKNPILISSFENNLIIGPGNGINDETSAGTQKSYGNTIFGTNNIQELSNNSNANLNTVYGIGNFLSGNNGTERKFSINNSPNKVNFNTVIGSYNFLSGSARLPITLSDIFDKNFLGSLSNGSQSDIVTVGSFNALNVNGGQNTNSSMVIIGNENLIGVDTSKNIIAIGQQNLISDRADRNDFRKLESDIFIGNNILNKGLDTSVITPITECIFINSKKNDVKKPFYNPVNFASNKVSGSIFINALGPIKKINRSNKTYIGNTKNPFDDDDFDISIGDPAPVVLLSTTDNRIGSIYKTFDLSNYEKNRSGELSSALTEFKKLKLIYFSKKNINKSYFFIDFSNINSIDFPILSSYLVKDDNGNPIGFESYFLLPIMVEALNATGIPTIDENNILKVEHENVTVSGSTVIDAKNNSSVSSNDSNSTCFNLLLNGVNLMKGYASGDLTIGNGAKKIHLYGSEIWLIGNGGDFRIGDSTKNSKIALESGTNEINIGTDSTGNLTIGNTTGFTHLYGGIDFTIRTTNSRKGVLALGDKNDNSKIKIESGTNEINIGTDSTGDINIGNNNSNLNLTGKIDLNNGNFTTMQDINPDGKNFYMLMLDLNGKIFISKSPVLANTVSSKKYKKNIREGKVDIEKFKKLLPVIFDYKKEMNSGKKNQWGLIAEDVFDLGLTEAVEFDENGEIYGLNYRTIFMMLLKSYLDSLEKLENFEAENKELKDKVFAIEKKLENIEKILIL